MRVRQIGPLTKAQVVSSRKAAVQDFNHKMGRAKDMSEEIMEKVIKIFSSYLFGRDIKAIHEFNKYSIEEKRMIHRTKIVERNKFGILTDMFVRSLVNDDNFRNDYVISNYITTANGQELIAMQHKRSLRKHIFRFFKPNQEYFTLG